jgi:death-on-curing protein
MTSSSHPDFLSLEDVLQLHARQLAKYGGATGIRDAGLLESAVAAPMATFGGEFLYQDLFEMAAALIFGLASNHPFVDGNKRVAAAAGLVFLELNGVSALGYDEPILEELIMAVADGRTGKNAIAEFLRGRP